MADLASADPVGGGEPESIDFDGDVDFDDGPLEVAKVLHAVGMQTGGMPETVGVAERELFGPNAPPENHVYYMSTHGLHWHGKATRGPTKEEFAQCQAVDVTGACETIKEALGANEEAKKALYQLYSVGAMYNFTWKQVIPKVLPDMRAVKRAVDTMRGKTSHRGGSGNIEKGVKANVAEFGGISGDIVPLKACRIVHAWVLQAKTAASLANPGVSERTQVEYATTAFRKHAQEWWAGEHRRAQLAECAIESFDALQKAMLLLLFFAGLCLQT
jgi:hypothetical protein